MRLKFKVKLKVDVTTPEDAERQIRLVLKDAMTWARETLAEGRGVSAGCPMPLAGEKIGEVSMSYGTAGRSHTDCRAW